MAKKRDPTFFANGNTRADLHGLLAVVHDAHLEGGVDGDVGGVEDAERGEGVEGVQRRAGREDALLLVAQRGLNLASLDGRSRKFGNYRLKIPVPIRKTAFMPVEVQVRE